MRLSKIFASSVIVVSSLGLVGAASGLEETRADYIITFRSAAAMRAGIAAVKAAGGNVAYTYQHAINGVAVSLPVRAVRALASRADVKAIEADGIVLASATQGGATWGLDRVDQTETQLDNAYSYNFDGSYNGGSSRVNAYIIDTGILATHAEFSGRVGTGYSAIKDRKGTTDCNGHGTHVAGTVGGITYGVAKAVALLPVRVLDCRGSGTNSGVIAGIDWVISHHSAGVAAVANMSLGGGASSALDTAVANLVADGVVLAVAAGNSNVDACGTSPARAAAALTVGATQKGDARASYSNFGSCLDIFAPGSAITSAWYRSTTSTNTISGTSMASPHVAGVAALVLSANPTLTVADVTTRITTAATTGKVTSPGAGSPDLLLYSLSSGLYAVTP